MAVCDNTCSSANLPNQSLVVKDVRSGSFIIAERYGAIDNVTNIERRSEGQAGMFLFGPLWLSGIRMDLRVRRKLFGLEQIFLSDSIREYEAAHATVPPGPGGNEMRVAGDSQAIIYGDSSQHDYQNDGY